MKKYFMLSILFVVTTSKILTNPVAMHCINEFMLMPTGWKMELHANFPVQEYDTIIFRSSIDTALYLIKHDLNEEYVIVAPESLQSQFAINPQGDVIVLSANGHPIEYFVFGTTNIPAPAVGQSLCWNGGSYYYLDNSPTFGLPNDHLNAQGTVHLFISDGTNPVPYVQIYMGNDFPFYADSSGYAKIVYDATSLFVAVSKSGFKTLMTTIHIYPDSTYADTLILEKVDAVTDRSVQSFSFFLSEPFPNPFNPVTVINYKLPMTSQVSLIIYDVLGKEVATLVNEEQSAGANSVEWNASKFASGMYFCTLRSGLFVSTKKLLLLK